jgi:hypothetical protein
VVLFCEGICVENKNILPKNKMVLGTRPFTCWLNYALHSYPAIQKFHKIGFLSDNGFQLQAVRVYLHKNVLTEKLY